MSPEHLHTICYMYLNFLTFNKSASGETQRAYKTDLQQAFNLQSSFEVKSSLQAQSRRWKKIKYVDAESILRICFSALSSWSHLSSASRNRKGACLKGLLHWLYCEGRLDQDLSHRLPLVKVARKIPHFLSVDEILAVLRANHPKNHPQDPRAEDQFALILILYGGGLRVGEACQLRSTDFNPTQRRLRVLGKGRKERIVYLPHLAVDILAQRTATDYIWGPQPLSSGHAYQWIRNAGARAGLAQPLHPHALRHSFATHMLCGGTNLRVLQTLLGHSSLQATEKYLHLGLSELTQTMDRCHPLARRQKHRQKR